MILRNTFLAILLSLALLFSSVATGAAIPLRSIRVYEHEPESHQSSIEAASLSPPTTQSNPPYKQAINHLTKRTAYYFPETVPDATEIAEKLTTLGEAGLVLSSQRHQQTQLQNSIGTSPPIDTRARILPSRVLHMCELASSLSAEAWNATPTLTLLPLPPMAFFVFASSIVCVATIVSKMRAH